MRYGAATSTMTLIEFRAVSREYHLGDAKIPALRNVHLSIEAGQFVSLRGPSGSGKSTLCNLAGLLDNPTSGTVVVSGRNTIEMSDDEKSEFRNRSLGFVFQSFNLIPVLTAMENIMLPLQVRGERVSSAKKKARAQLKNVGMTNFSEHRPNKLSGGQQQRVAIARALVTNPELVIADEPTGNLDTETSFAIMCLMREMNHRTNTTFLIATHDQRLISEADRRLFVCDGLVTDE